MSPQECANYLGGYSGSDQPTIAMRDLFRRFHQAVANFHVMGYDDDVGKWRLWYMSIPNDAQGDWVWSEFLEGSRDAVGSDSGVQRADGSRADAVADGQEQPQTVRK